jgi:predicted nucleic acid-binding protein
MILVDTSVWIDHLGKGDKVMERLLDEGEILSHPLVIGELAMRNLHPREAILRTLLKLPQAMIATHDETLRLVSRQHLYGIGIGYVDAHLLAAARLMPETLLWTRDKRIERVADGFGLAFHP